MKQAKEDLEIDFDWVVETYPGSGRPKNSCVRRRFEADPVNQKFIADGNTTEDDANSIFDEMIYTDSNGFTQWRP